MSKAGNILNEGKLGDSTPREEMIRLVAERAEEQFWAKGCQERMDDLSGLVWRAFNQDFEMEWVPFLFKACYSNYPDDELKEEYEFLFGAENE